MHFIFITQFHNKIPQKLDFFCLIFGVQIIVVLSSSKRNKRLSHVTIAPITSTIKYKKFGDVTSGLKYPFHFLMRSNVYQFLDNDSVIKLEQLRTISKNRLDGYPIGQLSDEDLKIINKKISNFLDL